MNGLEPAGNIDARAEAAPRKSTTAIDLLILAATWLAGVIFVNPAGNFPLNDDWSFALTVKRLLATGDFHPCGWASMPQLTHALWGALFCLPFGYSFETLRASTLVLALVGVLGSYLLAREAGGSRGTAFVAAGAVGFNPLYDALSFTFMTDVPFTALMVLSAIGFVRALKTGSNPAWIAGTALALAATLSRQVALALPLAFAVAWILKRGIGRADVARVVAPVLLCAGALFGFEHWMAATGRLPALYDDKTSAMRHTLSDPRMLLSIGNNNTFVMLLYLGLFLLPVLAFALPQAWRAHKTRTATLFLGALALSTLKNFHHHANLMPLGVNVLTRSGIGPLLLRDTALLNLHPAPELPAGFWLAVTVLSLLGAAGLVAVLGGGVLDLASRLRRREAIGDGGILGLFLVLAGGIALLPFFAAPLIDRYVVSSVPLFAAGLIAVTQRFVASGRRTKGSCLAAGVLLAAFAVFALCGARDYLEWNRVRWRALDDLTEMGHVSPAAIDGGFEFNGLNLYDPGYRKNPEKSWWWVDGDRYLVASGPLPGRRTVREYVYRHEMPPYAGKILILEKDPPAPAAGP